MGAALGPKQVNIDCLVIGGKNYGDGNDHCKNHSGKKKDQINVGSSRHYVVRRPIARKVESCPYKHFPNS